MFVIIKSALYNEKLKKMERGKKINEN